jgi:NADH-quinone oxidoreductase subunit E
MPRFTAENTILAKEIIARYPHPKSALIPLLHLAQEQDGHVTDEAMVHIADLVGVTPAEVIGTCSFYEMFKREPVGDYLINVCTNIACMLMGGEELLHHLEDRLHIRPGSTTPDGTFTLEDVECIAACTEAPCLPKHGTLARTRQSIPADKRAGAAIPGESGQPVWMKPKDEAEGASA